MHACVPSRHADLNANHNADFNANYNADFNARMRLFPSLSFREGAVIEPGFASTLEALVCINCVLTVY